MNTTDFLRLIWPDGENFFVVEAVEGQMNHHCVPSAEAGARRISWRDKSAEGNVYFAMASFKQEEYTDAKGKRRRRTQDNVDQLKCFWIDMDCKGKTNDYVSQKDAVLDIKRLCSETDLPLPTAIVNSGYGVHAYWVLDESVGSAEWTAVAIRWRATLDAHQIKHDPSCTTDSARILRPIGTSNRKDNKPDAEVKLIGSVRGTVSLGEFSGKLTGRSAPVLASRQLDTTDLSLNMAAESAVEYRPSSIKEIIPECALLKAVAKVGGNVSEPLWHKTIGVVRYTIEAEKAIHFFSKGYPGYSFEETCAKSAAWNADGPPSCEVMKRESSVEMPEHCRNCKHFGSIKGPLQLGYPKVIVTEQAVMQTSMGFVEKLIEVAALPPAMDGKFKWENEKLWRCVLDKEETKKGDGDVFVWETFCEFLFYPASYYRDASDKHQMVWTLREREGVFKEFEITGGSLGAGGQSLFKELGERGVTASHGGAKTHMEAYITAWSNELKKNQSGIETFMRYGWHGDNFLHGDQMFKPDGTSEEVRIGGDAANMVKYINPVGDLETWKRLIDEAYNHKKMEQYQFIMGAGFGSILMPFLNVAGGPVLSAVSYTTGQGKTTAMRNAFGIYGCPDENTPVTLSRSSVTHKGIFAIAGLLHNFPVIVDETTNIDGSELSDIVYTWSQGQPRIRLTGNGELAPVGFGWSGFMLSSSNKPMTGIIAAAKPGADAELARLIEFDCSSTHKLKKEKADVIFRELRGHHGVAGRVYIQWVVSHQAEVRKMLTDTQTLLDRRLGFSGENRYWSAGYAAIVVGLVIAKRLGLVKFDVKAIIDWVAGQNTEMKVEIAANVASPEECFGMMLNELAPGIIVTDIEGGRGSGGKEPFIVKEPRGKYTGRAIIGTGLAYLAQPAVHEWCGKNQVDMKAMLKAGYEAGWVLSLTPDKRYPGKGTNFAMGQVRCIPLDWARLENSTQTAPMLAEVVQMCNKGGK